MCTVRRAGNYVSVYNYASSGDKIDKNEVGGPRSTYRGQQRCTEGFGGEPEGKSYLEDPCVNVRIILRWIFS